MSNSGEHFYNEQGRSRRHILGPQSTALRVIGIHIPWSDVLSQAHGIVSEDRPPTSVTLGQNGYLGELATGPMRNLGGPEASPSA